MASGLLGKLGTIFDKKELTDAQKDAVIKSMYMGSNPTLDKAYQADPATAVANNLLTTGTNTAPVAGGYTEGIARALSGALGGMQSRKIRNQYALAETAAAQNRVGANTATVAAANADPGARPPPRPAAPPTQVTPAALAPPPAPPAAPPQVNPGVQAAPPQVNPGVQAAAAALTQPPPQQGPMSPSMVAQPAPGVAPQATGPFPPATPAIPSPATPAIPSSAPSAVGPRVLRRGDPTGVTRRQALTQAAPQAAGPKPGFVSFYADYLSGAEGGYNAHDSSTGQPVNYGIDQKAHPDIDVKSLTRKQAAQILYKDYWLPSGADQIKDPKLQAIHADTAINMGVVPAKRMLEAANGDPQKYLQLREARYREIGGKSLKGWLNRNNNLAQYVGAGGGGVGEGGDVADAGGSTDIPPMPDAPVMPARQEMANTPSSIRLEAAQRMLADEGTDVRLRDMNSQPLLEQGYTDFQKIRDQREADIQAQRAQEEQYGLANFNAKDQTAYGQPFAERTAAIGHQYKTEEQTQQDNAAMARTIADNNATIAAAQAKQGQPKNLPAGQVKGLDDAAVNSSRLMGMSGSFKPSYAGSLTGITARAGDAISNTMSNIGLGQSDEDAGRMQWWRDYGTWSSDVRHGLYGSALTPQELAEWEKYTFSRTTPPDQIIKYLHNQQVIAAKSMKRRVDSAIAGGYDPEQVMALAGPDYNQIQALAGEKLLGQQEAEEKAKGGKRVAAGNTTAAANYAPRKDLPTGVPRSAIKMGDGTYMWQDPKTGKVMQQ